MIGSFRKSFCRDGSQSCGIALSRICACTPRSAVVPASIDCPGFSRTITVSHHMLRRSRPVSLPRMSGSVPSGITTSAARPTSDPKNSGGVTPTIVNGTRSTKSDRPIASAAPPNCRCQNA